MKCLVPVCNADASELIDLPLCASHSISVYRQMCEIVKDRTVAKRRIPRPTQARPLAKSRPGTIYFMRFGELVKIGFTTNLTQRIGQLRPDEVLATMPGTMRDEEDLHARFGPWMQHREYFLPNPQLSALIDSLGAPDGAP